MTQTRGQTRLVEKHLPSLWLLSELLSQYFERDQLAEPRRPLHDRKKYLGHTTVADFRDEPELP
jgi:hypothetical protein